MTTTLIVSLEIDPEQVSKFLEVAEKDAKGSRAEEGCLRFDVLKDKSAENRFTFYEVYKDSASIDAHKATEHYKLWSEFKAQTPSPVLKQTVVKGDELFAA
mmetsp:Transcript_34271/g.77430  ORF Transcript_34271/g.77430 Transcript_34271/m.77430 type:complete len:101 (-) Transcript_34271:220-522(-)